MDPEIYLSEHAIRTAALRAHTLFPRLTAYAPSVSMVAMPQRPDVAGYYDPSGPSVQINQAAALQMNPEQLAGLIALERTRGLLASPVGQPWLTQFPLLPEQRDWWDSFYLANAGDAPVAREERDALIKGTMLSRLLVGDRLPQGSPPLTAEQTQVADLFNAYARSK